MKDIKNSTESWDVTSSDPSSTKYWEKAKNKADEDSPYGEKEPSLHTKHK